MQIRSVNAALMKAPTSVFILALPVYVIIAGIPTLFVYIGFIEGRERI